MLTDEQIAVLDAVFHTGDIHGAVSVNVDGISLGADRASRAERVRYWVGLRSLPDAKEYLAFLREEALSTGGVPLSVHVGDLYGDVAQITADVERLRRQLSQTPGAPSALASLHGAILKARELQARASALYGRRDGPAFSGSPDGEEGASVRGVKVEWV